VKGSTCYIEMLIFKVRVFLLTVSASGGTHGSEAQAVMPGCAEAELTHGSPTGKRHNGVFKGSEGIQSKCPILGASRLNGLGCSALFEQRF
jgi:hypothetical protein